MYVLSYLLLTVDVIAYLNSFLDFWAMMDHNLELCCFFMPGYFITATEID